MNCCCLFVFVFLFLSFLLFFFFPFFFFFNDTATTEIYTLSLHDALPISISPSVRSPSSRWRRSPTWPSGSEIDRKSTRLNSSHANISYAVFCLKKKKKKTKKKQKKKNKQTKNK